MVFQPKRRTASGVTTGTGELLPHLLTLTPAEESAAGRLFSSPLLYPHGYLSPESLVLCAARTFLPSSPVAGIQRTIERPAELLQKYEKGLELLAWNYKFGTYSSKPFHGGSKLHIARTFYRKIPTCPKEQFQTVDLSTG